MIDQEIQRFIDETDAFYPADAVNFSIPEQRRWYDALCAEFSKPTPEAVIARDERFSLPGRDIGLRHYRRAEADERAVILFIHGGGFVLGGLESHNDTCNSLCADTGLDVIAVDYRLCPEYAHPAAFEDALAAFDYVVAKGKPVILVGDSAGGTLCASVSHFRRNHVTAGNLLGQVLIYPSLGADFETGSMINRKDAPGLTTSDIKYYIKMRAGDAEPPLDDPGFLPMAADSFEGLPPTAMMAAEIDPLCDDCAIYAEKLAAAGVAVHNRIDAGLIHGHLRARRMSRRAADSFAAVLRAIGLMAAGDSLEKM